MDIEFETPDVNFSLRSAALIICNNCILLAKSDDYDCFYTVGGAVRENETSENAVLRECLEETGHYFEIDRLVLVQERFYQADDIQHQELAFFYLMKEQNLEIYSGANTDLNHEHLHWIPIDDLKNIDLVPDFLRTALENIPNEITHIISYK